MRAFALAVAMVITAFAASAAELSVTVLDSNGDVLGDAVVWAVQEGAAAPPPKFEAVMDQRNRAFVPHVLPVQTGTAVRFPNSDNVRHQVYSFSAPKRFQLPLYEGSPAEPIVFDKPGVVALGCNIHDRMSAFIVIVDTPWFGKTSDGPVVLKDLPAAMYTVRVWHERLRGKPPERSITLAEGAEQSLQFTVGGR